MIRFILVLLLAAAGLARGAQTLPTAAADSTRARVLATIRAGGDAAALAACRAYLADRPWDLPMQYNLACLEARAGLLDQALASLERATRSGQAGGFDAVEHMAADPDLAALRDEPRFTALLTEIRSRLVLEASERGLELAPGRKGSCLLRPNGPSPLSSYPWLDLEWRADGLALTAGPAASWPAAAADVPRLVVTLGLPDPDTPYLARDAFVFAFGAGAKESGWGALWVPTLGRWQPVAELTPTLGAGGVALAVTIPWSLVQPLHPLADGSLGFNAVIPPQLDATPLAGPLAVFADPDALAPDAATRRVVRLDFATDRWREPAFLGRLDDSIVAGGVLDFELVVVSPAAGPGTLSIDFLDNQARSLLADGPQAGTVALAAGLQRLPRQASFAGLRTGAYQLRAELGYPGGGSAVWSTTVLNLAPGWTDSLRSRLAAVAAAERPTAEHLLAAVEAAVAGHRSRRHPGPIAKTLGDLDAMLERAAATGSLLPTAGAGLLIYRGPDGGDRLCTVYRPDPGAARGRETPVLVIDPSPGGADRLAARISRFYAQGSLTGAGDRHPLYLMPHLAAPGDAGESRAALDFARGLFGRDALPLAGVDAGGGTALRVAADGRGGVAALMILAGGGTAPWPEAGAAIPADRLAALPPGLPVDWTDFTQETARAGQGAALLQALADADVRLVRRAARGAPGPSQAADRIVLWAEELPVPGDE